MKVLLVIDMQVDFVSGSLGTAEARAIVPAVAARVKKARQAGETVIFTRDTHEENYLETQEGRNLPVAHCIRGTEGWQLIPELSGAAAGAKIFDKPTFGSLELAEYLRELNAGEPVTQITLIGLCTDICVISNAMLAKAALPEVPVAVEESCCAGVTPESHRRALAALAPCQIAVLP